MAELNPYIFRAYDVRGKVGIDITPPVFELVGRAYGTLVKRRGGHAIALGMDNRTSSRALKETFATGVLSTGLDVVDIGVNHTPLLYFAAAHWKLDGGATITGSHNPVSDNGVKMVHAGAAPLTESEIQGLLATIKSGDFERGVGTRAIRDPRDEYWDAIMSRVKLRRRLKVVVDAGNGIAGVFAPELLRRLGCEVVELYCESDGTFPHHLPDPEMEENMRDLVARTLEVGADVGVAYDGDADRVGVVDEKGRRHEGRPVTRSSSARCARTGSCWAVRSPATCSSARTGTRWTTGSSPRAASSSSWRRAPSPPPRTSTRCRTCTPPRS